MEVLREALRRAREQGPQALVTVLHTSGSTPRHAGARMLVGADGKVFGTIGGGRVELEATRQGEEVARGAPARRERHHLVRDLAMCCGGTMDLYVQPVAPSAAALARAIALAEARRPGRLITRLDGAAIEVEETAEHGARVPALDDSGERFVEPIWPGDRVILFGLGHVARAVGPVLRGVGFEIVVCDDGDTGALEAGAPDWASRVVESFDLGEVAREVGHIGHGDHVLIMTRDHAVDQRLLEQALALDSLDEVAYLGLIGSQGKIGRFKKRLEAKGIATPERWARLRAPIGLDIGAETPAEIAISVAAELIRVRAVALAKRTGA
ncbi:MAG TPA: xanthine dehydrogenase accessory protein XdhC [Kofleriaceae bacterium]|nr:xanthine dehydrogenase accessory protein XdhC [Kofleriaceae bacterium]